MSCLCCDDPIANCLRVRSSKLPSCTEVQSFDCKLFSDQAPCLHVLPSGLLGKLASHTPFLLKVYHPAQMMAICGDVAGNLATLELHNGVNVPTVGLGTYRSRGLSVTAAVSWALELGVRHIDTASIYKVFCSFAYTSLSQKTVRFGLWITVDLLRLQFCAECARHTSSNHHLGSAGIQHLRD